MLLVESEKPRHLRSKIHDIVFDTINKKTGGGTKYINRRDKDNFINVVREHKYRKNSRMPLTNMLTSVIMSE